MVRARPENPEIGEVEILGDQEPSRFLGSAPDAGGQETLLAPARAQYPRRVPRRKAHPQAGPAGSRRV